MSEPGGPPHKCPPAGSPAWMATFGDMMSLLLTFFVLLLSFANMDVVKFRDAFGSLREALGVQTEAPGTFQAKSSQAIQLNELEAREQIVEVVVEKDERAETGEKEPDDAAEDPGDSEQEQLQADIQSAIEAQSLQGLVEAVPGDNGVTIRVKGSLVFKSASDDLRSTASSLLDTILQIAEEYPYSIAVEGHTDRVPIQNDRYPSNWHLSAARAVSGVNYLIERGIDPTRLKAAGYGSTRPLVPEVDPTSRGMNRRLEFVFYHEDERPAFDPAAQDSLAEALRRRAEAGPELNEAAPVVVPAAPAP